MKLTYQFNFRWRRCPRVIGAKTGAWQTSHVSPLEHKSGTHKQSLRLYVLLHHKAPSDLRYHIKNLKTSLHYTALPPYPRTSSALVHCTMLHFLLFQIRTSFHQAWTFCHVSVAPTHTTALVKNTSIRSGSKITQETTFTWDFANSANFELSWLSLIFCKLEKDIRKALKGFVNLEL